MYKNNSRHCSNFRGCSPHQRLFRLKSLHPAIGCYSCTNRCATLAKKGGLRWFLDVLCHCQTRHSPAGFSSSATTGFWGQGAVALCLTCLRLACTIKFGFCMGKIYKIGSANFASQTGRAATTVGRVLKSWHKLKKGNVPPPHRERKR